MNRKILIHTALTNLNKINKGDSVFESLCSQINEKRLDLLYLPATGLDAGGDGGTDGWSESKEGLVNFAYSINQNWKKKLKEEIEKTKLGQFNELKFFTNQNVKQSEKSKFLRTEKSIRITIFDLENLEEIISKDDTLGRIIGIPAAENAIVIDYLTRNNQFEKTKNEITGYLHRHVFEIDSKTRDYITNSILEYCTNLPQFTILEARAGYGKTYCLQSLHQAILSNIIDIKIPPVFVSLRNYTKGKLQDMIKEGMAVSGDFQIKDALFLLDGYDEVPEIDRIELLKEINQNTIHSPYIRKVLLSVRENTYDSYQFTMNDWEDIKTIFLLPLQEEDVQFLLNNRHLNNEQKVTFLQDPIFNSLKDNIFYVIKLIDFFEEKQSLAGSIVELFDFLIRSEINRVFRKPENYEEIHVFLESLALYMTLHQKSEVTKKEISEFLNLPNFPSSFAFSHKNLQEYLAAKKISRQPLKTMLSLVTRGNQILPYMTNTFGFLLNLLNDDTNYSKFEEIIEWSVLGGGNAKTLLQIEPDKITKAVNIKIFKSAIEQEARSGNIWNIPSNLIEFCLSGDAREANIQFLVEQLETRIDSDEFFYFSVVLQMLLNRNNDVLSEKQETKLKNVLLNLLESENIDKNKQQIEYILFVVSKFKHWKFFDHSEYTKFKNKLLSFRNSDTIFDNFCALLINSNFDLTLEHYLELLNYILGVKLNESHQVAHYSPKQIDDSYRLEYLMVAMWNEFLKLSKFFLNNHTKFFWDILHNLKEKFNDIFIHNGHSDELKEYLNQLADFFEVELSSENLVPENKHFLIEWLCESANNYTKNPILFSIQKFRNKNNIFSFLKDLILFHNDHKGNGYLFGEFLLQVINSKNDFDNFRNYFFKEDTPVLLKTYKHILSKINTSNELYNYMLEQTPSEIKNEINNEKSFFDNSKSKHDAKILKEKLDYKIAFNLDKVKNEILLIFKLLRADEIQRGKLWESQYINDLDNMNQFVLFLLRYSTTVDDEIINHSKLLYLLDSMDWDLTYMDFLIQYCSTKSIDINFFSLEELELVFNWIKLVADRYPLDTIDSPLKNIHRTLSYVLRKLDSQLMPDSFQDQYGGKFLGLAFSGFPNQMHGAFLVNYDSFSLNYLDKVLLYPTDTLKFIIENFEFGIKNIRILIGITGYINSHIDLLVPGLKKEIKTKVTKYIIDYISEDYYPAILDCAYQLGFSPLDIDSKKISDALMVSDEYQDLVHNISSSFFNYGSENFMKNEEILNHLKEALLQSFNKENNTIKKKIFAEYFLKIHRNGGQVFHWYVDYLLSNDENAISSKFVRYSEGSKIYSNDINDLFQIEKLFVYSKEKDPPSERRRAILDFAISSYKEIGNSINSDGDLIKIIESIDKMIVKGHSFMNRVKSEIINSFHERNYKPMDFEGILALV